MRINRGMISLVLAIAIVNVFLPMTVYASKFTHVYGPQYTGPYGRVLDTKIVFGYLYGTTTSTSVNASTYPTVPMNAVMGNTPIVDPTGGTMMMVWYKDHEALFTVSFDPSAIESAQSSSTIFQVGWDTATIVP